MLLARDWGVGGFTEPPSSLSVLASLAWQLLSPAPSDEHVVPSVSDLTELEGCPDLSAVSDAVPVAVSPEVCLSPDLDSPGLLSLMAVGVLRLPRGDGKPRSSS